MKQTFLHGTIALVTGASSGIGAAVAALLAQKGYIVYGASRRGTLPGGYEGAIPLIMDVTDEQSVRAGVQYILERSKRIDIVIHAAGDGLAGPIECGNAQDAKTQMDVNYFGAIRLLNETLPLLRGQQSGLVLLIGSVGGMFSVPFQTLYSASKAALLMLSNGLRLELRPFHVKAALIAPGDVKTGFTHARKYVKAECPAAYEPDMQRAVSRMERDETNGMPPERVAKKVLRALNSANPRPVYTVGGLYAAAVFFRRFLPERLVEKLLYKLYIG